MSLRLLLQAFGLALVVFAAYWQFSHDHDPLSRMDRELQANPMWMSGGWNIIRLGPDAGPDEIVVGAAQTIRLPGSPISRYSIVQQGEVRGSPALLLDTNRGQVILLYSYQKQTHFWAARFYDPPSLKWY